MKHTRAFPIRIATASGLVGLAILVCGLATASVLGQGAGGAAGAAGAPGQGAASPPAATTTLPAQPAPGTDPSGSRGQATGAPATPALGEVTAPPPAPARVGRNPSQDLGGSIPAGPGAMTTFPDELPNVIPLDAVSDPNNVGELAAVSDVHFKYALQIPGAGDRSLALSRIAMAATMGNQLEMADRAVVAAAVAAMEMPPGLVRDQRLIANILALDELAEKRVTGGAEAAVLPDVTDTNNKNEPAALKVDRVDLIRRAQADWKRAGELSRLIENPTYRAQILYRVADSMAGGSQGIVNDFPKMDGTSSKESKTGLDRSYEGLPDRILQDAALLAAEIDRPVWHDRALVAVAAAAAQSRQFGRAVSIARLIPQPEVRTDGLLKVAEAQARLNDPEGATATYKEAALAVASIPLADPRAVLAGVLIDNLISVGRFDDARASVPLYADQPRRLIALGAIAESMGRRGQARDALGWINKEISPEFRSQLYRRVSNGVIGAIEYNRNRELNIKDR